MAGTVAAGRIAVGDPVMAVPSRRLSKVREIVRFDGHPAAAGAGLDVFEREPAVTPALCAMENVVLLPHLGSATEETRTAMGLRAAMILAGTALLSRFHWLIYIFGGFLVTARMLAMYKKKDKK